MKTDHITYQRKSTFNNIDTLRANGELIVHQLYYATNQNQPYIALQPNLLAAIRLNTSNFIVYNGNFTLSNNKLVLNFPNSSYLRPGFASNYDLEIPLNSQFTTNIGHTIYIERTGTGVPSIVGASSGGSSVTVINQTDIEDIHDVVALVKVSTNEWVVMYLHSNADPGGGGGGGGITAINNIGATGSNQTLNGNDVRLYRLTLTGNIQITLTNGGSDFLALDIVVTQDGTGNRNITNWNGNVTFPAGIFPQLSASSGAVNTLRFIWDGINWRFANMTDDQS